MKFIVVLEDGDPTGEVDRMVATIRSSAQEYRREDAVTIIGDHLNFGRKNDRPRMNIWQLLKLWRLCGDYDVPFRESDYIVHDKPSVFSGPEGSLEGWVGGNLHNGHNNMKQTIYVMVEKDGASHS